MRKWITILLLAGLISPACRAASDEDAADKDDDAKNDVQHILENMGYPELQVVPRASERIKMESRSEGSSWYYTHWPIELSGLATAYVGFTAGSNRKDDLTSAHEHDAKTIAGVTQAVGLAWVVGGVLVGAQRPYMRGEYALKKFPGKDERSALLRERLAEEYLERPARTMRVLQAVSVITNFSVNAASMLYADQTGKMMAGVGLVLSFLPLVFEDHNITVHDKHIEYKKKIYAPLKSASFHYDPFSKTLTPVSTLTWNF